MIVCTVCVSPIKLEGLGLEAPSPVHLQCFVGSRTFNQINLVCLMVCYEIVIITE